MQPIRFRVAVSVALIVGAAALMPVAMSRQSDGQQDPCGPNRVTLRNGTCGTPDQALAEFAAQCQRDIHGSIPVPSAKDGYECGCPPGQALTPNTPLLPWLGRNSCVPLQFIAAEAAARCTRQNPDLIPSAVRADGTFDCQCPEGRVWLPESGDNPRGRCVSAQAQAHDAAFCERTLAGSILGTDNQGRRACVCPFGYLASAADKKCVPDPANPGRAGQDPCGPNRVTLRNGTCGTPDQALAEFAAQCQRDIHGSIPVPSAKDGYECGCPPGQALTPNTPLLPWLGRNSCVPLQFIAAEAAARCTRQNPDLIPSAVRADGTFDCQCPEGRVWLPESGDNPRGRCVSAQAQAHDAAFCERTLAGSILGTDNQGRRACVCPFGYQAPTADKKCAPDPANPGRAGWTGQVSGSWTSSCIYNGYPVEGTPSGGFTLTFDGRGAITGAFVEGANASISGTVAPDGALQGQGSVVMEGRRMALSLAGTVSRTPAGGLSASGTFTNGDGRGVTCTGRWGS